MCAVSRLGKLHTGAQSTGHINRLTSRFTAEEIGATVLHREGGSVNHSRSRSVRCGVPWRIFMSASVLVTTTESILSARTPPSPGEAGQHRTPAHWRGAKKTSGTATACVAGTPGNKTYWLALRRRGRSPPKSEKWLAHSFCTVQSLTLKEPASRRLPLGTQK